MTRREPHHAHLDVMRTNADDADLEAGRIDIAEWGRRRSRRVLVAAGVEREYRHQDATAELLWKIREEARR